MNNGNVNVVILLDLLTKALDVVDHDIMAKGPMLSVPVDLFMSRCKRSCSNSFIFTRGIANCVF
jgi:hypothetical protein